MNFELNTTNASSISKRLTSLDLILMKGFGNYTWMYFADGSKHLSSKTMQSIFNELGLQTLVRTHKSYTINMHYCKKIMDNKSNCIEMVNGLKAEVSRRKRKEVMELMTSLN